MSRNLISVDPGKHALGVACFREGVLISCALLASPGARVLAILLNEWAAETGAHNYDLAIEVPQIYARARSKGDPNDLIDLAVVAGAVIGGAPDGVKIYRPAEWKGQTPKHVTELRVLETLSAEEKRVLDLFSGTRLAVRHNVVDAIGIGLHHLRVLKLRL